MRRVIYLPDSLNKTKYVRKEVYEGHTIYEEMCPSGFKVHQSWAVVRESDGFTFKIDSYNQMCYAEVLDAIDGYNLTDKYGLKALMTKEGKEHNYWTVHNNSRTEI